MTVFELQSLFKVTVLEEAEKLLKKIAKHLPHLFQTLSPVSEHFTARGL
jgi:hypothetical protein